MRSSDRRTRPLLAAAVATALAALAPGAPVRAEDAPEIRWETDLAAAAERAGRLGKPVLLVQGFGAVDEPFC